MYRFSRALFLEIKDLVDPHPDTISVAEARRRVLEACEDTIERLAREPRYFARPARSLFEEIRHLFPITQQARIYYAIEQTVQMARSSSSARSSATATFSPAAVRRPARASRASARRCPTGSTARRTSTSRSASRSAQPPPSTLPGQRSAFAARLLAGPRPFSVLCAP